MILEGDCLERLRELADCSIDAVVTDPPYGIGFMGKGWDRFGDARQPGDANYTPGPGPFGRAKMRHGFSPSYGERQPWDAEAIEREAERERASGRELPPRLTGGADSPNRKLTARTGSGFANRAGAAGSYDLTLTGTRAFQAWVEEWGSECLRVLKPGGHLLSFGGTRTYHRLAAGLEDAGFEIRDCLAWMFGSGFPKSLDVSKAIDKVGGDTGLLSEMAGVLRAAREARGLTIPEADAGFCDGSTAWPWYEGRTYQGEVSIQIPGEERAAAITAEWPEVAPVFEKLRRSGAWKGRVRHGRGGGESDFGKVVGSKGIPREVDVYDHGTEEARTWQGWGTALKPAFEPVVVARKPLGGTVAANVLAYGTGALNIDGCRVEGGKDVPASPRRAAQGAAYGDLSKDPGDGSGWDPAVGRWPANVVLDEEAGAMLDEQTGQLHSQDPATRLSRSTAVGVTEMETGRSVEYGDTGGASRFFYCAKVSRAERNAGLEGFEAPRADATTFNPTRPICNVCECGTLIAVPGKRLACGHNDYRFEPSEGGKGGSAKDPARNHHPTVKPIALMRWLARLVTPPGGTVLDPFLGSGSTGIAAALEGFEFVGIEREADYLRIAEARIAFWTEHGEAALRAVADREEAERGRQEREDAGQLEMFGS